MKNLLLRRTIFDTILFAYFLVVVGVLLAHPQSDQEQLQIIAHWPVGIVFLCMGALLSYGLNRLGTKTLGEVIFEPAHKKVVAIEGHLLRSLWGWQLLVFLILTFVLGLHATDFSVTEILDEDGFRGAIRLFTGLLHPNFTILPRAILNIVETIFIAFIATSLAIPVAFFLCFFCAKNIMRSPWAIALYTILRTFMNVTRSVEAMIWAIIFSVWVGIGPFAGMLALMIHSIASLTKQYSEIVETVSSGPIEGIQSTGASELQTIWYAIVPQVIMPFISFTMDRWDINVRMATIIGLVGGGGIGTMLIKYQGQAMWSEVGCIILVIAFVVWFMDTASAYIREALK